MIRPDQTRGASVDVLYVSDEPRVPDPVRSQFERRIPNVTIDAVTRPTAVLDRLSADHVDCVVTAQTLSTRTGVDLVEAIRAQGHDLPVLLFTDRGTDEFARRALRAGVTDYVPVGSTGEGTSLLAERVRRAVAETRDGQRTRRFDAPDQQWLERTTDAVYAVDADWRIEYMNETMADRVGRDPETLVGKSLWEEFPSVVGTGIERRYRTAMETGLPVSFEKRLDDPFGYWVQVRAFPDADGLTVFSRDVTEERERQQELERQEAVLQTVYDAVLVIDDAFTVQFANAAAARGIGDHTTAEVEGEPLGDLLEGMVSDEDARRFTRAVRETLDGGDDSAGPYDVDLQLGVETPLERRCYDVRLTPFEDDGGRQVLVVARDLTDQYEVRRQLERERNRLRELQAVMADVTLSTDERVRSLLEVCCESLGLDIGIVSEVEGDTYTVHSAYAPEVSIEPGDRFDLSTTYCEEVVRQDAVCAFVDAVDDGKESHPAYQQFELEAYIGAPLTVDGDRFGTLNFSSPTVRAAPFDDSERTLVELVAELVGTELSRERRRRALERQQALFERAQEIADIGIWEYDPVTEALHWSSGVRRIHGVDAEYEPTLADGIDFYHPDDRDRIAGEVERAVRTGGSYDLDLRIVRADGEVRDVRAWGTSVTGLDGQPVLRGVLQDITDRKRRERELQRARQQFETFTENVDHAFFLVPPDYSEVTFVNAAAEELYGVSEQELRRDPTAWLDRIHPDDVDAVEADVDAQGTAAVDWPQVQQFRLLHPERGVLWLRSRIYPIRDDGEVVQLAGIAADVTQVEKHGRKLERLQQYTSRLIDVSDTAEAARIGVDAAIDVVGVDFCRIQLQRASQPASAVSETGTTGSGETAYERSAGDDPLSTFARQALEERPAGVGRDGDGDSGGADTSSRHAPMVIPLGGHGAICVSELDAAAFDDIDTTLLELLAEALAGALSRAERTTLLRERERELEAQNDRLEKFASIVSHDLRNPLGVANGYLELAEERGEPAYFEKTASALDRMEALVDDLLTLSKAGTALEAWSACPLTSVARDAWEYVETADATLRVEADVPTVEGDESILTQLFENLFRNSVEHGSAGPRSQARQGSFEQGATGERTTTTDAAEPGGDDAGVTVRVGPLSDRTGFYVADDGVGIPPEKREEVFEYGYTSSADGTGFGLAIVTDLAAVHGWSVDLTESAAGGARFEFGVPESGIHD
ncbi:PAS domain-containing protein [Salinigranum sp.]|uniref:PAS domain-containing protein n=1 Tax=Salinigranum sp. TaxID=1966351 RepID=UPI0035699BE3